MDINCINSIKSSIINRIIVHTPIESCFFPLLLAEKCPEIFSKQKDIWFTSESFALNRYIFVALANKNLLLPS